MMPQAKLLLAGYNVACTIVLDYKLPGNNVDVVELPKNTSFPDNRCPEMEL